jgi:DNA repair exonuclease SbcCD ATPase subunit
MKDYENILKRMMKDNKEYGEEDEEDKDMEENKMTNQTKSRYEVITDLETQKRTLIRERDGFEDIIRMKEKMIKNQSRELEDQKEELQEYKKSVESRKETIKELIRSIDESLNRLTKLSELQSQKKQ